MIRPYGRNDHRSFLFVQDLVAATGAPVRLHPDDTMLWDVVNAGVAFEPFASQEPVEQRARALAAWLRAPVRPPRPTWW